MSAFENPDVSNRIPKVKQRLEDSASGFIRVTKFGGADRTALSALIVSGDVEIFQSPLGKAYRVVDENARTFRAAAAAWDALPLPNFEVCGHLDGKPKTWGSIPELLREAAERIQSA